MEPIDLLFCPKCNEPAKEILVILETELKMAWDEDEQEYRITESYNDFNDVRQQLCAKCHTELEEGMTEE